jgi:hypothetical protein
MFFGSFAFAQVGIDGGGFMTGSDVSVTDEINMGMVNGQWVRFKVDPMVGFEITEELDLTSVPASGIFHQFNPFADEAEIYLFEEGEILRSFSIRGRLAIESFWARLGVMAQPEEAVTESELFERGVWTFLMPPVEGKAATEFEFYEAGIIFGE